MSETSRVLDTSVYVRHTVLMRRLVRANEFDGRRKKKAEIFYFCDANVLIELGTIMNLAHATNLFGVARPETLDDFFDYKLENELGPEATGVIVGAFETASYIASGRLPGQARNFLFVTQEHYDEFTTFRNYLQSQIKESTRETQVAYGSENAEINFSPSGSPIQIVKELLTQIDDKALLGLMRDTSVLHRLTKIVRSGRIMTENVVTGAALDYDEDLATTLYRAIAETRTKSDTNAKRDGVSLAKLTALNEKWRVEGSQRRCVLLTRDAAMHSVYRSQYFSSPLGQTGDADDWYLLREPAQYAPVLNIRDLRGAERAGPSPGATARQSFENLGAAALGVLSALRVLTYDSGANNQVVEEYHEEGAFLDNVRSTEMLMVSRTPENQANIEALTSQWREATLASVAMKANIADIPEIVRDLTSWLKQPRNLQNLLRDVESVTDQAAHDHAAFALHTVREANSTRHAVHQRSSIILFREEERQIELAWDFKGAFEDYRRAAIECLERDAWMAAVFFARRGRRLCVDAEGRTSLVDKLESEYLVSVSCRLALRRMADLDEALTACKKALSGATRHALADHALRARSEMISVQMTQWIYAHTFGAPWAISIRPPHLDRARFFLEHKKENEVGDLKKLVGVLERELVGARQHPNVFLRTQVERQLSFNLFIARWLLCAVEADGRPISHEQIENAYVALTAHLSRVANGNLPLLILALRDLALFLIEDDDDRLMLFRGHLAELRRPPDSKLPSVATDRLAVEYLLRASGLDP
ncbi:hypothetical protein [Vitreimonas flagellata]|uniref:hypothetical protein n=1 Tax=Vitreimonas flagellata TaxID=2560861 RepID=UPI0010756715|nr:hypothetical protein [Vitreimonas flagellata]